jgi:hypothetical protein
MPVVRYPVETIRERLMCECGSEMLFSGSQKLSKPPLNEHVCKACGKEDWRRDEIFPRVIYEQRSEQ